MPLHHRGRTAELNLACIKTFALFKSRVTAINSTFRLAWSATTVEQGTTFSAVLNIRNYDTIPLESEILNISGRGIFP